MKITWHEYRSDPVIPGPYPKQNLGKLGFQATLDFRVSQVPESKVSGRTRVLGLKGFYENIAFGTSMQWFQVLEQISEGTPDTSLSVIYAGIKKINQLQWWSFCEPWDTAAIADLNADEEYLRTCTTCVKMTITTIHVFGCRHIGSTETATCCSSITWALTRTLFCLD